MENYNNKKSPVDRKYLVIGGTGMLADMCHQLPADELILASRFRSNQSNLATFDKDILKVALDYADKKSQTDFLEQLADWTSLEYCVLWVHSYAHDFSCEVIKTVAQKSAENASQQPINSSSNTSAKIIHVFGTDVDDSKISQCVKKHGVEYIAVKLGDVEISTSPHGERRWMTNEEISEQVWQSMQ